MPSRIFMTFAVGFLLALSGACCWAQTATVQPGDTVKVSVLGSDELGAQTTVDSDGRIALPLIGTCTVAGRTAAEASGDIRKALLKYVKDPKVNLEVIEKAKWTVVIAGRVKKAGAYGVAPKTSIVELVALAGGPDTNADMTKVQLVRQMDRTLATFNVQGFMDGKDLTGNPPVRDGDVVMVPESVTSVGYAYVLGEVRKIGTCELRTGMRVHEAIAQAGGLTEMADSPATTLKHANGELQKLDLTKALAQDPKEDTVLAAGDTIYVPTLSGTFNIYGAVNRPGQYPVKGQLLLTDALTMAGGYTGRARVDKVRILRANSNALNVNVANIESRKSENVAVLPGDTVSVPEAKGGTNIWTVIGTIASLGVLLAPR